MHFMKRYDSSQLNLNFQCSDTLVIDYQYFVIDYIILKNIWNVENLVKSFLKSNSITGNRLQEAGNRLLESKYSSNLEYLRKLFL